MNIYRYGTKQNFSLYHEDYIKLYVNTIRDEIYKSDSSKNFLTSSPSNGIKSDEENFVAINPLDSSYGDSKLASTLDHIR